MDSDPRRGTERNSVKHLLDLRQWRKIHYQLAEIIGANLCLYDFETDAPIVHSHATPYCFNLARPLSPEPPAASQDCLGKAYWQRRKNGEVFDRCGHGLFYFMTDVFDGKKPVGMFVLGPLIIGKRESSAAYEKICAETGINPEVFCDRIREVNVFSHRGVKVACDFLKEIVQYVVQFRIRNQQLEDLVANLNLTSKSADYADELSSQFFDLAMETVLADSGSLLFWDDREGGLFVKELCGMNPEVTESARIPLENTVTGWVMENQKPALITGDSAQDPDLKSRLKRTDIYASMLVPLKSWYPGGAPQSNLRGVLCLNTKTANPRFTETNLRRIVRLGELASVALAQVG